MLRTSVATSIDSTIDRGHVLCVCMRFTEPRQVCAAAEPLALAAASTILMQWILKLKWRMRVYISKKAKHLSIGEV